MFLFGNRFELPLAGMMAMVFKLNINRLIYFLITKNTCVCPIELGSNKATILKIR